MEEIPLPLQAIILHKAQGNPLIVKELIFELYDKEVVRMKVKNKHGWLEVEPALLRHRALVNITYIYL